MADDFEVRDPAHRRVPNPVHKAETEPRSGFRQALAYADETVLWRLAVRWACGR
jgi:hypothetical protein